LTVVNDYSPILVVPPEVRALDPAWASCELDWEGTFDPPEALASVAELVPSSSSPTAAPAAVPASPQADPTPAANAEDTPTTNSGDTQAAGEGDTPAASAGDIPAASAATPVTVATVEGEPVLVDPSTPDAVVVAGQTLSSGGSAATIGGTIISVASGSVQIGTEVIALPTAVAAVVIPTTSGIVVTGTSGETFTVLQDAQGNAVVGTLTLSAGGAAATIDGQVVSAAVGGAAIGASALQFSAVSTAAPSSTVLTVNGQVITAVAQPGASGVIIIGSQTISVGGPAATVNGQLFSAAAGGLVVNGKTTIALATGGSRLSTTANVGGYIASGIGFYEAGTTQSSPTKTRTEAAAIATTTSDKKKNLADKREDSKFLALLFMGFIVYIMS
jgi:hypothetical protein